MLVSDEIPFAEPALSEAERGRNDNVIKVHVGQESLLIPTIVRISRLMDMRGVSWWKSGERCEKETHFIMPVLAICFCWGID